MKAGPERKGVSEEQVTRRPSPYHLALRAINKLTARPGGEKVIKTLAWFPNAKKQAEIEAADDDTRASFTAKILGHDQIYTRSTASLVTLYRDQDRERVDGHFGLNLDEAGALLDYEMREVGNALYRYTDFLVDEVMKGNIALIATKLKSVSQALGLNSKLIHRVPERSVRLTFIDGSVPDDSLWVFVEELPGEMPVLNANYDPQNKCLSLKVMAKK